jgi:hypothetical protein
MPFFIFHAASRQEKKLRSNPEFFLNNATAERVEIGLQLMFGFSSSRKIVSLLGARKAVKVYSPWV